MRLMMIYLYDIPSKGTSMRPNVTFLDNGLDLEEGVECIGEAVSHQSF